MDRPTLKSRFKLIEGGARPPSPWLDLPSTLVGRPPLTNDSPAIYRLAKQDALKGLAQGRRQPLLDAWSAIVGQSPPVPNVQMWDEKLRLFPLTGLLDATSCFRGLKRPQGPDDHGWDSLAFVSKPSWQFRYRPHIACVVELCPLPTDVLFVTYVRLDHPEDGRHSDTQGVTRGVITHWHFVEADPNQPDLPLGYGDRYRKRIW
jgi:hypothetical protein